MQIATLLFATISLAQRGAHAQDNPLRVYQLRELQRATITIGKNKLKTWVMDTPSKQAEGMMFLKDADVAKDDAMIFVFPDSRERSFWMRNTLISLDIAYVNEKKVIISTSTMKARDETGVPSKGSAMYAIEMKHGAFQRLGIKKGQTVGIPKDVKAG